MLRITELPGADGQRVRLLEGRLTGPWVSLLAEICREDLAAGRVVLDLSGLMHAGRAGVDLLRRLQAEGVALRACPPYLRAWFGGDCA